MSNRIVSARLVETIEVVSVAGAGTDADPMRYVTAIYAKDGTLVAESDPGKPRAVTWEQVEAVIAGYHGYSTALIGALRKLFHDA